MQKQVDGIVGKFALDKAKAPSKKGKAPKSEAQEWKGGKRADHDTLPVEIQALYAENATIMHQMRELHLKLRTLSTAESTCPDSDRYPFLKEIIALDKRYHKNWQIYDNYSAEPASPTATPDSVSANAPVKTAAIATPSTTAAETAEPTAAEFRQQQKKIYRQINLTKGRFKKNPTDALRQKLAVLYAQLASPTGTLTTELKELGIIE